jgi:hypothetical protein
MTTLFTLNSFAKNFSREGETHEKILIFREFKVSVFLGKEVHVPYSKRLPRKSSYSVSYTKQLNSVAWVRKQTISTKQPPFDAKFLSTFADRGWHVVSVTVPYGHILEFIDRSRYFTFK